METSIDIDATFGAMFTGALITMSIYGITTLQLYFYYLYYPKDGYATKMLAATVWILDTLHVVLMCHAMHHYLISGFGNPLFLVNGIWSLYISIAVNIVIALVVQCFFTQRIYKLSPPRLKWWLTGIIAIAVVAHFCLGIETVVFFMIKGEFARLHEVTYESALPFAIMAILSDVIIAAALCVLLDRNRSAFKDTNSLINRLIIFAINRCLLTSTVAVIEVILFVVLPNSFYVFAIDFIIGKLYANSLLATLNSRQSLRHLPSSSRDVSTGTSFHLASVVTDHRPARNSLIGVINHDNALDSRMRPNDDEGKPEQTTLHLSTYKGRRSYPRITM